MMKLKWTMSVIFATCFVPALQAQGQIFLGPSVCPPPVYCSPPTIDYYFTHGQSPSDSKVYRKVQYSNGWFTVPVIRGFVPELKFVGGKTIYDYRARWLLSEVVHEVQKQERTLPPPKTFREEPLVTKPKPPEPPVNEHDGQPWKSGIKKPATGKWRSTRLPVDKPEVPFEPPFKTVLPTPKGMKVPDKIGEPEKKITPNYEKK